MRGKNKPTHAVCLTHSHTERPSTLPCPARSLPQPPCPPASALPELHLKKLCIAYQIQAKKKKKKSFPHEGIIEFRVWDTLRNVILLTTCLCSLATAPLLFAPTLPLAPRVGTWWFQTGEKVMHERRGCAGVETAGPDRIPLCFCFTPTSN